MFFWLPWFWLCLLCSSGAVVTRRGTTTGDDHVSVMIVVTKLPAGLFRCALLNRPNVYKVYNSDHGSQLFGDRPIGGKGNLFCVCTVQLCYILLGGCACSFAGTVAHLSRRTDNTVRATLYNPQSEVVGIVAYLPTDFFRCEGRRPKLMASKVWAASGLTPVNSVNSVTCGAVILLTFVRHDYAMSRTVWPPGVRK